MSSFTRRIERQVVPSRKVHIELDLDGEPKLTKAGNITLCANPPRKVFYQGRGDKLGVFNPKGREYLARIARENKRAARQSQEPPHEG